MILRVDVVGAALDADVRDLCLKTLKTASTQLKAHTRAALKVGVTPVELREAVRDLREAAGALSAKLDSGQGTLGRLAHDQELFVQIRVLQLGLRDLIAALKEDPMGSINIELF